MQGCTDSVVETVDARSAQLQASATAQNGEAEAFEARGQVPITALTPDLKVVARTMERDRYPEPARPRPMRVSGRVHARENGGEEALGSVWTGEPDSAYGARASRRRP